jgi:hypothetical protein
MRRIIGSPRIEVDIRPTPQQIWHYLFGHSRIGRCGEHWDYIKHELVGIYYFCYECGMTWEETERNTGR